MNQRQGVVLYGPPAVGKDTVTAVLSKIDDRYAQFQRLKIGSGKTLGYRMGTPKQLAQLRDVGDVVYENSRYGNTYLIDRLGLDAAVAAGVPVVHLGQVAGVHALVTGYPAVWTTVLLWCSREVTAERSEQRGDADTPARLAAWDATRDDLEAHQGMAWDLTIETAAIGPEQAARRIDQLVKERAGAAPT